MFFFPTKYMANDDFSEPPGRAVFKNRFFFSFFFLKLASGSPPGPGGQSRIFGGLSIEPLFLGGGLGREQYRTPPSPSPGS